jgi:predicted methyltransferase
MNLPALSSSLRRFAAGLALLPLVFAAGVAQAQAADALPPKAAAALAAAVDGAQRSAAYRARDAARHPKETLLFFGLRPDMKVIEIAPGGGWYTEVLAPVLRDRGEFYAAHYPLDSTPGELKARNAASKTSSRPTRRCTTA